MYDFLFLFFYCYYCCCYYYYREQILTKAKEDRLLQARKEVEEKFESEKWQRIADVIEAKGGNKYPNTAIQKKLKEFSKKANGATTGSVAN